MPIGGFSFIRLGKPLALALASGASFDSDSDTQLSGICLWRGLIGLGILLITVGLLVVAFC